MWWILGNPISSQLVVVEKRSVGIACDISSASKGAVLYQPMETPSSYHTSHLTQVTELRTLFDFVGVGIARKSKGDGRRIVLTGCSDDLLSCNRQKLSDAASNSSEGVLACFYESANGERMASNIRTGRSSNRIARQRGSRQRVVAYLGELKPSELDGWAKLGSHLEGRDKSRRRRCTRIGCTKRSTACCRTRKPSKNICVVGSASCSS